MVLIRRALNIIIILLLLNTVILMATLKLGAAINAITIALLVVYFVKYNIIPMKQKQSTKKLKIIWIA